MKRLLVGPFNRVEGDLEVTLDIADGRVRAAHVNAPMYRGFEQILQGKAPHDALVYVPMPGAHKSLNVVEAACCATYEYRRQWPD